MQESIRLLGRSNAELAWPWGDSVKLVLAVYGFFLSVSTSRTREGAQEIVGGGKSSYVAKITLKLENKTLTQNEQLVCKWDSC